MNTRKGRTKQAKFNKLFAYYQKERKPHIGLTSHGKTFFACGTAKGCLDCARTKMAWDAANGEVVDEFDRGLDAQVGDVRLRIVADCDVDLDNLFGDTYNPKVNDDIPASRLEREREAEIARVDRDGVWGVQGQCFDGRQWQTVDSCYGFIGDDWKSSGYDVDIMDACLDEREKALSVVTMFD